VLLNLERVSKAFKGLQAVQDVTLQVNEGEILGLIGPNGAGKTTLFNLITGVYRPETGRVVYDSHDITRPSRINCRQGIARTFQIVRPFMQLTVLENVTTGRVYGRETIKDRRRAEAEALEMIELVGLGNRVADQARRLTLVDRKRMELARALATRPKLLLLDELLAGLNPSEVLNASISFSIRAMGITIVMVEHLVKRFWLSNRIVVLNAGQKIMGNPAEVADNVRVIARIWEAKRILH
jgi:branched-chain amino acid transport system ATP-binding protein